MTFRSWARVSALCTVGALGVAVWAQPVPASSFSADVALGVAHESNAMRYSDIQWGSQPISEDTVRNLWLGVQGHYTTGPHRLQIDGRWAAHRYRAQPELNHDEHLAKALWHWQPLRWLATEWALSSSRRRALPAPPAPDLTLSTAPAPSSETREDLHAQVRWGLPDRQQLELGASARDVNDGDGSSAAAAYTQQTWSATWKSAAAQVLQGSWRLRGLRGREAMPLASAAQRERYRGEDLQAQATWWVSGVEGTQRLEAGWGFGRLRYRRTDERSVDGHFGRLAWQWQPQRHWQAQLLAEQVPGIDVEAAPAVLGEASNAPAVSTRWTRTARAQVLWHTTPGLSVQAQLAQVSRSRTMGAAPSAGWTETGHLGGLGAQWRTNGRETQPYLRCDYTRERWSAPSPASSRVRWQSLGCRLGIALK